MVQARASRFIFVFIAAGVLAGCAEGQGPFAFVTRATGGASESGETAVAAAGSTRIVERDVEAPEIFQVTDQGLWDGRPSLGGVWVAHSGVKDPERVIIRNEANGKFVIGALFRRERDNPGPKLQVSSDAASALGLLAGAPVRISVTALKREEVPVAEPAAAAEMAADPARTGAEIETAALDPLVAGTAAAIERAAAPGRAAAGSRQPAPAPAAAPAPTPVAAAAPAPAAAAAPAAGPRPDAAFLQVGIFAVEDNAKGTAAGLGRAGLTTEIRRSELNGKPYWRVLVGPAATTGERAELLGKVKAQGFTDAYAVKG